VPLKGSGASRLSFTKGPAETPLAPQLSASASRARRLCACTRARPRKRRSSGDSGNMTGWRQCTIAEAIVLKHGSTIKEQAGTRGGSTGDCATSKE
jgi:hypothetical protein